MTSECTLSTGKLPLVSLPMNDVVGMNDRPDMTSAVYHGRKAMYQTNKPLSESDQKQERKLLYGRHGNNATVPKQPEEEETPSNRNNKKALSSLTVVIYLLKLTFK